MNDVHRLPIDRKRFAHGADFTDNFHSTAGMRLTQANPRGKNVALIIRRDFSQVFHRPARGLAMAAADSIYREYIATAASAKVRP